MKHFSCLYLFAALVFFIDAKVSATANQTSTPSNDHIFSYVNIYSNLAEIVQPLVKLPLEFSADQWWNIRADTMTLVGRNVNVTEQTITEKKKSLNNQAIYIRSPLSTTTNIKYLKATMIDEDRNLVRYIDPNIGQEAIYYTIPTGDILHTDAPPTSKFYVNFQYKSKDAVYVSYLRSNLNWKTSYQLHLFDESIEPKLIVMADIRNDGKSKVNIEHAELLGGDINLRMPSSDGARPSLVSRFAHADRLVRHGPSWSAPIESAEADLAPSVEQGKEFAGLYVFRINQSFSIDAKTNYILPMFRPQVIVKRIAMIKKTYFEDTGRRTSNAHRIYRLSSDKFLSRGNCMVREYDHLVGETSIPDLAANNTHDFSLGEDSDIVYKENVTLVSKRTYNETMSDNRVEQRTLSIYNINILLKNFKRNRSVNVEYEQAIQGRSVKLIKSNGLVKQDGSTMEHKSILVANEEKFLSYDVEKII